MMLTFYLDKVSDELSACTAEAKKEVKDFVVTSDVGLSFNFPYK